MDLAPAGYQPVSLQSPIFRLTIAGLGVQPPCLLQARLLPSQQSKFMFQRNRTGLMPCHCSHHNFKHLIYQAMLNINPTWTGTCKIIGERLTWKGLSIAQRADFDP